jgi:hypothetical protein
MKILIFCVVAASTLSGCMTTLSTAIALDSKLKCITDKPNAKRPERVLGEFPFRLTYENDGAHGVIEDTKVCRFKSRECVGGGVWMDFWQESYASGRSKLIIPAKTTGGRSYIVYPHDSCSLLMNGQRLAPPQHVTTYLAKGVGSLIEADRLIIKEHGDVGPDIITVEQLDGP